MRQCGFSGGCRKKQRQEGHGSNEEFQDCIRSENSYSKRHCGVVMKSTGLEVMQSRFESQLCHMLSPHLKPWASNTAFLKLCPYLKMEMALASPYRVVRELK